MADEQTPTLNLNLYPQGKFAERCIGFVDDLARQRRRPPIKLLSGLERLELEQNTVEENSQHGHPQPHFLAGLPRCHTGKNLPQQDPALKRIGHTS